MPNKEVTKEVTDFRVEFADNGFTYTIIYMSVTRGRMLENA
jgi:hypothetical protein